MGKYGPEKNPNLDAFHTVKAKPVYIYLFKVNQRNTKKGVKDVNTES